MTKKQQQKRESTPPEETSQKASKKQKTVAEPVEPTRRSEHISLDITNATKSLRISSGSESSSRSSYGLKDLPSVASKFLEEDMMALNATFKPADEYGSVIPDVEATNLPSQYLLPQIGRDVLKKEKFDVNELNTTDIYVKQFFWSLNRVVVNLGVDVGTDESKTDSLVVHLLTRACGFDGWPFGVRIKEKYRLMIDDKKVTANPDFVVDMGGATILVVEDKHLKNVFRPDYGEAQILAEILACGWENWQLDKTIIDQTIYAIRVISSYVTFYKAKISEAYWKELRRGLPRKRSIEILRWPGENDRESGLDLAVPEGRHTVLEAIIKIRQFLLQSTSSTTTTSTAVVLTE